MRCSYCGCELSDLPSEISREEDLPKLMYCAVCDVVFLVQNDRIVDELERGVMGYEE